MNISDLAVISNPSRSQMIPSYATDGDFVTALGRSAIENDRYWNSTDKIVKEYVGSAFRKTNYTSFESDGSLKTLSYVTDATNNIANKIGCYNTLSASGTKILSLYKDSFSTEKFYFDKDGVFGLSGKIFSTGTEFNVEFYKSGRKAIKIDPLSISMGWYSGHSKYSVMLGYGAGYDSSGVNQINFGDHGGRCGGAYSINIGRYTNRYYTESTRLQKAINIGDQSGYYAYGDRDFFMGQGPHSELIQGSQSSKFLNFLGNIGIFNPNSLGPELLTDGGFADGDTYWDTTGSVSITSNQVVFSGAGTLYQELSVTPGELDQNAWYCFQFDSVVGSTATAILPQIHTDTALAVQKIPARENSITGWKIYFRGVSPFSMFKIESFSGTSCTLDNLSCKKVIGGFLSISGNVYILGNVFSPNTKVGTSQVDAGATEGEFWADSNNDYTIHMGV